MQWDLHFDLLDSTVFFLKKIKTFMYVFIMNKKGLHSMQTLISGAKEDRTPDPLLAKQVLSQLSYNPKCIGCENKWWA